MECNCVKIILTTLVVLILFFLVDNGFPISRLLYVPLVLLVRLFDWQIVDAPIPNLAFGAF